MRDKEAIGLIQETAQKAVKPEIVRIPGDSRHAFLVHGDYREQIDLGNGERDCRVMSVADLVSFAKWWCEEDETPRVTAWHSADGLKLVLNEEDRRDRACYPLTLSKPYKTLQKLDSGDCSCQMLEHRQLMRLLRVEFARCLQREDLVPLLARIDWTAGDNGGSTADRGRESLGREVHAAIVQADLIPETFLLDVPVFENRDVSGRITIECALEIFPAEKKFRVTPLPGQVSEAMETAQSVIHTMLTAKLKEANLAEKIPIFFGTP